MLMEYIHPPTKTLFMQIFSSKSLMLPWATTGVTSTVMKLHPQNVLLLLLLCCNLPMHHYQFAHFILLNVVHNILGPECAAEGSPTIYTRASLPYFCLSVRMKHQRCNYTSVKMLECRQLMHSIASS